MKCGSSPTPLYHLRVKPFHTSHALALFLAALVVRLGWMPTWSRLVFEGHESLYRDAFLGEPVRASTQAYPVLIGIYQALGQFSQDERALVVFSAVVGALAVLGSAVWVGRIFSPRAGLWTGVLVTLLPEHVAWSTSAYNVILPQALIVWALVFRGRLGFVLCALAVSMRVELVLLTPLVGLRGVLGGISGVGVLIAWGITFTHVRDAGLAFDFNWPMFRYLGPPVLLLSLAGLHSKKGWLLFAAALWVHAVGAGFDDYGSRHALLGGVALCGLVATARSVWIPVIATVALGVGTIDLAQSWHAPDDGAVAREAEKLSGPPAGCVEVTDEPPVSGQALPSHVRFFRAEIDSDCVMWGEEFWHRSWSSRGLNDRATRMKTIYTMKPVGALKPRNGGPVRLYHRLEKRW